MDNAKVKYFSVVARRGAFARRRSCFGCIGAGPCHAAVTQLETEFGFDLFMPAGRGIVPTDNRALATARRPALLSEYESFVRECRLGDRIGSFEIFSTHVLAGPSNVIFAGVRSPCAK